MISPGVLDVQMALELNRLDMIDESLLQVTNIERTRAVALAQNETVALAQVLKVKKVFSFILKLLPFSEN